MKTFRKVTALLLTLCFVLAAIPAFAKTEKEEPQRIQNSDVTLDEDASGGYEGDYVVIYNPATSYSTSYSTGTMTGLIETSVGSKAPVERTSNDGLYKIDVDAQIAERERKEMGDAYGRIETEGGVRASYVVGSTKTFTISSYSPSGSSSLSFKVLAVGEHCYIWTPTQNVANYYTLDSINPDYAQQAADEFDRMYSLMNSSFGNHSNGNNGDGKVSLLFYNIDDGFDPETSSGYIAGYFSSSSYYYDGLPIINIDTYPGVYYVTPSGVDRTSLDSAYGTACHEYQHCINYSNTSGMSTWLNECFSAAAEEICYPGSSVVSRIQSWENYFYSSNGDWLNPPTEFQYTSDLTLHKGFSMYDWDNYLEMDDTLALYAQVSFFAQYLYTQFGNSIYKQISNKFSSSETTAITNATGMNCADLVKNFRVATFANTTEDVLNGVYGFKPQADYDPANYHNVQNPYSLLGPVVFTGTSATIKGGGAICVKPVNGVYNPPSGANSNLKYIGIKVGPNVTYEVSAVSNNNSYGTVSVDGYRITANPANGYYVESAEVISGTATVTVNGNIITVNPSSDCTVRVNFAPKPVYTVNFVSCGASQGSQTAYLNDTITLPMTSSVDPEGWEFIGWVGDHVEETTTVPAYYEPGASYTVTGNTTFYALYTRVEDTGGDIIYQQTNDLEVGGRYIIASGNYAAKNTTYNTSNNHYVTAQSITVSNNLATLASSVDPETVLWEIESGSASAGWVFKNNAVGKYFTLGSDEYLCVGTNSLAWTYNGADMNNQIDSEGYYYLLLTSGNAYFTTSKNTNGNIRLYQEISPAVNYYCTDPVIAQPTYYTVTFKDWDGTVLSTQTVEEGTAAAAPAVPGRTGYTFTGWDVDFSNVTSDLVVTAQYQINSYTLTIYYKYANGTTAKPTVTQTYNYGANYSVTSPAITGYTPDQAVVAGTMGAGSVEVTVTYTVNSYTLTINYLNEDDEPVAPAYTAVIPFGESYSVTSPEVEGYTTEQTVVTGTMPAADQTVNVYYTADEPVVEPLLGDVDCNGVVDMSDISMLFAYLNGGSVQISEQGMINANANLDGDVNIMDISEIFNIIANS